MEEHKKDLLSVGKLVVIKKSNNSSKHIAVSQIDLNDTNGIGIVLEKLTELFVFPQNPDKLDITSSNVRKLSKQTKNSVKTKICKVYWFNIGKSKWEYEDDLQVIEDETSDS